MEQAYKTWYSTYWIDIQTNLKYSKIN